MVPVAVQPVETIPVTAPLNISALRLQMDRLKDAEEDQLQNFTFYEGSGHESKCNVKNVLTFTIVFCMCTCQILCHLWLKM